MYPYSAECYLYQHWNLGRSLWPYWQPLLPAKMNKERGAAGYVTMNDGSLWITGNLFLLLYYSRLIYSCFNTFWLQEVQYQDPPALIQQNSYIPMAVLLMDLIFPINEVVIVLQKLMITGLYWLVHVLALGFLVQAQSSMIQLPMLLQMDQIWYTVDAMQAVPSLEAQNTVEDQFWLLLVQENLLTFGILTILTPGKQVHTYSSWLWSYNLDTVNACTFWIEHICSAVQCAVQTTILY